MVGRKSKKSKKKEESDQESEEEEVNDVDEDKDGNGSDEEAMQSDESDSEIVRGEAHEETRFSQEAVTWSNDNFGEPNFAKYFDIAKDRAHTDLQEMKSKRRWNVRLNNLKFMNHGELADFFLVFNFGWNFSVTPKRVRVKIQNPDELNAQQGGKSKQGKRGKRKDRPRQAGKLVWIPHGTRGVTRLTSVRKNVPKGQTCEFVDLFDFVWKGSYFDLFDKSLRIEVWDWNEFHTNTFMASHEIKLKSIASGVMNYELEIKQQQKKKGRIEWIVIGKLQFQCVVQEVLKYQVKLANWSTEINPFHVIERPAEWEETTFLPYARFKIVSDTDMSIPFADRRHTNSKAKTMKLVYETQTCDTELSDLRLMTYRGTRLSLEDCLLHVDVYDKGFFSNGAFSKLIGSARIPLKSVVQNGFLQSDLSFHGGNTLNPFRSKDVFVQKVGVISGNLDVECEQAKLWREFAQSGELQPPELRDYPPYRFSYLAVNMMSCRDLLGVDVSGLSDPYVTVEWAGQRQNTRMIPENLNPVFDETLYFHIRAFDPKNITPMDLIDHPSIQITVWDFNETGSSDFLGTTKVYLHEITGCPRGERVAPQKSKPVTILKRKRKGKPLRPDVIRTRVLRSERKLTGLKHGIESFVKFEAYFRGPDGDLMTRDLNSNDQNAKERLLLPNLRRVEQEKQTFCLCFSGLSAIRGEQGGDGNSVTESRQLCEDSVQAGRCKTMSEFYAIMEDENSEASQRLLVLEQRLGLHTLQAKNQYGVACFLPTFLQPMTPPRSAIDHSELEYLLIVSSQKPNSCYKLAQLVRGFEFEDFREGRRGASLITGDTWISPDFFLSMCKGDVKSHVLLQCNAFLGMMTDVYVCLGYTYVKPSLKQVTSVVAEGQQQGLSEAQIRDMVDAIPLVREPYVWLMTRESDSECCGKFFANRDVHGGAVKFWEVTMGGYFPPLPNRWAGKDDAEEYQNARGEATRARNNVRKSAATEQTKKTEDAVQSDLNNNIPDLEPAKMLSEEDILHSEFGAMDEHVHLNDVLLMASDVDVGRIDQRYSMLGGGKRADNEDDTDIPNNSSGATGPQAKANGVTKKRDGTNDEDVQAFERRLRYIRQYNRCVNRVLGGRRRLPYCELVAVFNHRNMWVNIQDETDPCNIAYDFEAGASGGWLPVVPPSKANRNFVKPHYPARNFGPPMTKEAAAELCRLSYDEIKSSIVNYRSTFNIDTTWADDDMSSLIEKVLIAKNALESLDKTHANGWDSKSKTWIKKRPPGCNLYKEYNQSLRVLDSSAPRGFRYRLQMLRVNSCDPKAIRKHVLNRARNSENVLAGEETPLYDEYHGGREMFCVGVHVVSLHSGLATVMVGLMVVIPESTDVLALESKEAAASVSGADPESASFAVLSPRDEDEREET